MVETGFSVTFRKTGVPLGFERHVQTIVRATPTRIAPDPLFPRLTIMTFRFEDAAKAKKAKQALLRDGMVKAWCVIEPA